MEEWLRVLEAEVVSARRHGWPQALNVAQGNMANCLFKLGRLDGTLKLSREIYESKAGTPYGRFGGRSAAVINFAVALFKAKQFAESRALLLEEMPEALRFYGPDDPDYLYMRYLFARVTIFFYTKTLQLNAKPFRLWRTST